MTLKTARFKKSLPHQGDKIYIADGGLETTFIFLKNIDLPEFAAFDLLNSDSGIRGLREYYQYYIDIALQNKLGLMLGTPTWRANASCMSHA
jgi:homocysteine S-methyltransferase